MKILVFGGRYYGSLHSQEFSKTQKDAEKEQFMLNVTLDELYKGNRISLLISGGAKGADKLGELWANKRGIPTRIYRANWHLYNKRAGIIRNQTILDNEIIDLAVKFSGGVGTADMLERLINKGIKVLEVN